MTDTVPRLTAATDSDSSVSSLGCVGGSRFGNARCIHGSPAAVHRDRGQLEKAVFPTSISYEHYVRRARTFIDEISRLDNLYDCFREPNERLEVKSER